ncbi:MAG: hypothetical protein E6I56_08160 [Chloroflexi bacterium]|nr:MAG: hypothetical protein E6I56_08160 [Chloroflexota bacterium]
MIDERYREDRERRRLGSLTVYSGPTHSGKTKKLEADTERAQRQGRHMQYLSARADPNDLVSQLDPATELVAIDNGQQYDDRLIAVADFFPSAGGITRRSRGPRAFKRSGSTSHPEVST